MCIRKLALRGKLLGQPKVPQLHAAASIQEYVAGLDVPVQHGAQLLAVLAAMALLQRQNELSEDFPDEGLVQETSARAGGVAS